MEIPNWEEYLKYIENKLLNGERLEFWEFAQLPDAWAFAFEYLQPDDEQKLVSCPNKGCDGTVKLRKSKYAYGESYLGCTMVDCNFCTTKTKLMEKSKQHPQCPYCQCRPTEIPKPPVRVDLSDSHKPSKYDLFTEEELEKLGIKR